MIRSVIREYGIKWSFNRFLYLLKIKGMQKFSKFEKMFEISNVKIEKLNILNFNFDKIESFIKNLEESKQQKIIDDANLAINGKLYVFSSLLLDYGSPMKWNYNPLTDSYVDLHEKWFNISDFDENRGDIKVIWEPSRFTHYYLLIRAHMLTKDSKYYQAFSEQLADWVKSNEYSYGPNYKCGQEASLRMINVLSAYTYFNEQGMCDEADVDNVSEIVLGSYKKVVSNFFYTHKCIKNNHTFSELMGMSVGAWCTNDNVRLSKVQRLINDEIKRQFRSDGGYIQNSFNYQRFALQIISMMYKLSEKTNVLITEDSEKILLKSILQLYSFQSDSGILPNYGSNDGALIFPLSTCDYTDYRPSLSSLYGRIEGKRLYEYGSHDEESLWFNGEIMEEIIIKKSQDTDFRNQNYVQSGLYNFNNRDFRMMLVAQKIITRPAQMDQLHLDLWKDGKNLFCDSGTYSYATELGNDLLKTGAHNTIKTSQKEQMSFKPPFFLYNWPELKNVTLFENRAEIEMKFKTGYAHKRVIEKLNDGYKVIDQILGSKDNFTSHLNTVFRVVINDNKVYILENDLVILTVLTKTKVEVERLFSSRYYLRKTETNRIKIHSENGRVEYLIIEGEI